MIHRSGGRHRRPRSGRVVIFVALAAISVALMYPFFYMLRISLMSNAQYVQGGGFSLESWQVLFNSVPIGQEVLNSLILCVFGIAGTLLLATPAGFALAKLPFRGHLLVFIGIVGSMMIPLQSIIIPEYVNLAGFVMINTFVGAILLYVAIGTPFSTFLMATYFRGIPDDLTDAGLCDGLNYWGLFMRVGLPLAGPALATIVVLRFIPIWNDFLIGLLFLQEPSVRPLTVGLGVLASSQLINVPALMAGSLLSTIPAAITYVVFQRYLVRGLTLGSLQ
jgi:multiple sugar transport system permease protein/raffinose/stachyose/melibiose transport system permease protein